MAALLEGVIGKLIEDYRPAPLRHVGGAGGRTDGRSGYAGLLASATLSLLLFRSTRWARAPKEVLGEQALEGVLVVERYKAYNRAPGALPYCCGGLHRHPDSAAGGGHASAGPADPG